MAPHAANVLLEQSHLKPTHSTDAQHLHMCIKRRGPVQAVRGHPLPSASPTPKAKPIHSRVENVANTQMQNVSSASYHSSSFHLADQLQHTEDYYQQTPNSSHRAQKTGKIGSWGKEPHLNVGCCGAEGVQGKLEVHMSHTARLGQHNLKQVVIPGGPERMQLSGERLLTKTWQAEPPLFLSCFISLFLSFGLIDQFLF